MRSTIPNAFEKPFPEETDLNLDLEIAKQVGNQKLADRLRKIRSGEPTTNRPKKLSQAEILAKAQAVADAANEALKLAQPEVERANTEASLRADMASYKSKGLNSWSEEVSTLINRWNELPQSERDYLINKRKEGFLIIGMPSAETQLKTIGTALDKLIPTYTNPDTKKREPANPTKIWWDHAKELINKKDPSLTANTPKHPYFLAVEPSERPPADSCNKVVNGPGGQIEWIAEQHTIDPYLFSINLLEYSTFQVRNTENGQEPIDTNTWTRLVEIQRDGGVLGASWDPVADRRRLRVSCHDVDAYSVDGVRLSGRI